MDKDRDYTDMYFTELGDLEITPPEDVWMRIDNSLRKKRAGITWFLTAMAAGLALLLFVGGYLFYSVSKTDSAKPIAKISPVISQKTYTSIKAESASAIETTHGVKTKHATLAVSSGSETKTNSGTVVNRTDIQILPVSSEVPVIPAISETKENIHVLQSLPAFAEQRPIVTPVVTETDNVVAFDQQSNAIPEVQIARKHQWSVAGQMGPLYSFRKDAGAQVNNENEKALIAYAGGFKVDYQTSRRISIQAGVYLSVIGQQMGNVKATTYANSSVNSLSKPNLDISNSMGPISNKSNVVYTVGSDQFYGNVPTNDFLYMTSDLKTNRAPVTYVESGKIRQEMKFIEVPLLVRYKLLDKKIGFHLISGITTHFLVDDKSLFLPDNGTKRNIGETKGLSPVNYSTTIGIGLNYMVSPKVNFSLEPTYKYYLNSFSTLEGNDVHPYSLGIFTGFFYKF